LPLSLSLLHPRWRIDGGAIAHGWTMRYQQQNEETDSTKQRAPEQRLDGDRYRDGGRNMLLRSTLAVLNMQQQLTG
jgi:hypothetical protein